MKWLPARVVVSISQEGHHWFEPMLMTVFVTFSENLENCDIFSRKDAQNLEGTRRPSFLCLTILLLLRRKCLAIDDSSYLIWYVSPHHHI
jgi:hypothetical protein